MKGAWDIEALRRRAYQQWAPATGVEASQGAPFKFLDGGPDQFQTPADPGVNLHGWVNPYSLTFYPYPLSTTQAIRVLARNLRRTYLLIQNQGPGNVYLNFAQDVTPPTLVAPSNGMQLITTQFYEQIGGGGIDMYRNPVSNAFVSPDFVSAVTDTAGTTLLLGEGVWVPMNK